MKPVIVLGCGGHARVLLDMLLRLEVDVLGFVDPRLPKNSFHLGCKVLGNDNAVLDFASDEIELVNGIGSIPKDAGLRSSLFLDFQEKGYSFKTVVDPLAFIAADSTLLQGVQAMVGVKIQSGAVIASNTIVNTGAIVEHDCRIGNHVHIAPGAILSGNVEIGNMVHIGTGAIIIQGISIGAGSIIGAGSVVTCNIGPNHIVFPARALVQDLAENG